MFPGHTFIGLYGNMDFYVLINISHVVELRILCLARSEADLCTCPMALAAIVTGGRREFRSIVGGRSRAVTAAPLLDDKSSSSSHGKSR